MLEMRGITKRYPGVVANDAHRPRPAPGRDPRPPRRERRGQVDPDEHPLRAGGARRGRRSCIDGEPVEILGPHDAIDRGISMVHQHFMLVPVLTVAENILLGEETMANPVFLDRDGGPSADRGARPAVRLRDRPGRQDRDPVGRLAAAGRDPQGPLPQGAHPRPRRADRRPHPAGDRGDLRRPAPARGRGPLRSSSSATSSTRSSRSPTGSRSSGAAGSSASGSRARRTRTTWPSSWSAASVQLTVDRGESHPADVVLAVSGPAGEGRPGREVVRGVDLEVRAGEILGIAGVAGNGQDELVEVADRPAQAERRQRHDARRPDVTGWSPRQLYEAGLALRARRPPSLGR